MNIRLCGHTLKIDVRYELERYDWGKARWYDNKLISCSPLRYDKTPSFFVNLDIDSEYYGCWADSGAYDADWASGNFTKLLSFLRNETYEETEEYLLFTYSTEFNENTKLPPIKLPSKRRRTPLDESKLDHCRFRHNYLEDRGITEAVQQMMGVGYDTDRKAVTMPWRLPDGRLANIKYRRVNTKIFWYVKGGLPIRGLIYGMDIIYKKRLNYAVICEAEIDAMSFMVAGVPAIALGGSAITKEEFDVIKRSPLETLYIATDNDKAGEKLRKELGVLLEGYIHLVDVKIPVGYKDANEAHINGVDLKNILTEVPQPNFENRLNIKLLKMPKSGF